MYTEGELQKKIATGLTFPEVEERIKAGQVNGDMNVKTKTIKQIIKDNLFTLFNLINLILFVCIIISGSLKNGLFFLVVIWNFLIGVIQEVRAKKTIDKLSILSAPKAHVLRNGEVQTIPVKDIVLGDVMELKNGHQICADAVVLKGSCQVNESLITGESTPIVKNPGDHILSGSYLVSGYVLAEVEHIGADNYVNKITLGAKYFKKSNSIIMDSVKKIVKVVGIAILPLAALMIWKNFFSISQPFPDAMVAVVASVSAMIPGGLVLLVSIVLAVSVVKLSRHKTLVQDLYSVENLARVDVICLDKTGTITEGVMQVEEIIPAEGRPDVPFAEAGEEGHMEAIKLFAAMMVDENSTIEAVRGALTELPAVAVTDELKNSSYQVPFSSDRKWSSLYIEGKGTIFMGAPERVCPDYVKEGTEAHALIAGHIENSRRVVVIAYSPEKGVEENLPSGIKPLCFIVIGDRVRANAKKTLQYFAEQDVTIKVISGDNPVTVSKVAFEAGLEGADKYIDASGIDSYEEIEKIVDEYTIFGRVTPYQKLDLVKALKAKGHTVAMTGDGANDVLALKEADCSIAMQSGSDAARNVANMVLLDSDFASLPLVVAEGRKAINNLQRSSALYLSKTAYAFILAIIFIFVPFAYPFQNIQVTLIGALTIGLPSFVLALEPDKNRIKGNFLKNVFRYALPSGLMSAASFFAVSVIARFTMGATTGQVQTLTTLLALVLGYIFIFNISGKMLPWKGPMLIVVIVLGVLAWLILPGVLSFEALTGQMFILMGITAGIYFIIHTILYRVVIKSR